MTKMIKMSLVAALAVSGLSASIKDSSVSGKFEVEYDYSSEKSTGSTETTGNTWDLDVDATVKTPIADNITAILTVQADDGEKITTQGKTDSPAVDVAKHYVSAKVGSATVNVGRQGVGTPFFDDERGNGIVALMPAGGVTLAAANFTNVNGTAAVQTRDITAAAVIGGANNVNYSLWYAAISNTATAYSLNLSTDVSGVSVDFRHTSADYGDAYGKGGALYNTAAKDKAASLTKIVASMPVGAATVTAGYGMTGDDADRGAGVDLESSDTDAAANFGGEFYAIDDLRDASAILLGASTKVGAVNVYGHYLTGSHKSGTTDLDFSEVKVGAKKALNKSTKLTAFYATGSEDTSATAEKDQDALSMAVEYKF
jgi:hypothetical protein